MLHGAMPAETFFAAPLHIRFSKKFQCVTAALAITTKLIVHFQTNN